jgi:predicted TIM-barrel fold metal-dependent hydrolase
MIVDVHTHVFPPGMIAERARLAAADAEFGVLYGSPRARMATAEELLASMDAAGVDRAVACGFWWRSAEHAAEHREYLLEAATASGGRLLPFVPVAIAEGTAAVEAAAAGGAAGLGEVRTPDDAPELAADLDAILGAASARDLPLLVHCSEEVGHAYPGKGGGLTTGALWRLVTAHPRVRVIAAHWGGGFPFYALMPEVRALLDEGRVVFDSAASPLLYDASVFDAGSALLGDGRVLWGSDFPLRGQAQDRAAVEGAVRDATQRAAVLGANAARFLGLS